MHWKICSFFFYIIYEKRIASSEEKSSKPQLKPSFFEVIIGQRNMYHTSVQNL